MRKYIFPTPSLDPKDASEPFDEYLNSSNALFEILFIILEARSLPCLTANCALGGA